MTSEVARRAAEIASHDIGIREQPANSNRGPRIEQYQRTVGLLPGDSYCIAACCTWAREAAATMQTLLRMTFSGSCLAFWKRNVGLRIEPRELKPDDLPCIGILDHDGIRGHAFLAVGFDEQSGKLQTIEANTNPAGSRDGGGVYALNIRSVKDAQLKGFIRIE